MTYAARSHAARRQDAWLAPPEWADASYQRSTRSALKVMMIAVLIEIEVRQTLNWPFAAALSAVLLVATLLVYAVAQRFTRVDAET